VSTPVLVFNTRATRFQDGGQSIERLIGKSKQEGRRYWFAVSSGGAVA
jgi:hypothetical protein